MIKKVIIILSLAFFAASAVAALAADEAAKKSGSPAQSIYSWFGGWDKGKPRTAVKVPEKPAAKPVSQGKNITQSMYDWFDDWANICVNKGGRHCYGTWDSK